MNGIRITRLTCGRPWRCCRRCARAWPGAQRVNVSSRSGLIAPAGQTAGSASQPAQRGLFEARRREMERPPTLSVEVAATIPNAAPHAR